MIDAAIRAQLLGAAGVAALVVDRVDPVKLPQGPTFPAITYALESEKRQGTFRGPTGLPGSLYRVDCWGGDTYTAAKALSEQVRLALDGKQWTADSTTVQACILEGQEDLYEDEVQVHRVALEFRIWWNEAQA